MFGLTWVALATVVVAVAMAGCAASPATQEGPSVSGVRVEKWSGGARAAVSLTFDDNNVNQIKILAPMLEELGLRGTFFVITKGRIDIRRDGEGSWKDWKAVHDRGHEIASHGTHKHMAGLTLAEAEKDFADSKRLLQERIGVGHGVTFAYPFNEDSKELRSLDAKYYIASRRECLGWSSKTTAADANADVKKAIEKGVWLVEAAHSTDGDGYEPPPSAEFRAHFEFLKSSKESGELWVAPFGTVARYVKERRAASVEQSGPEGNSLTLVLKITRELPPEPVPLTVSFDIPAGWQDLSAQAGDAILPVKAAGSRAMLDVMPAAEPVTVVVSKKREKSINE
ncbi:MAG: polysaccharide deacetylase family protein [Planctomycetes bacterium]|nr:polysaccharide deacetylase family protein [Planctomycetota bacterium]